MRQANCVRFQTAPRSALTASHVAENEVVDFTEVCGEATVGAAEVWATVVENQEDVVGAMRLDAVEYMTEKLSGTRRGGKR